MSLWDAFIDDYERRRRDLLKRIELMGLPQTGKSELGRWITTTADLDGAGQGGPGRNRAVDRRGQSEGPIRGLVGGFSQAVGPALSGSMAAEMLPKRNLVPPSLVEGRLSSVENKRSIKIIPRGRGQSQKVSHSQSHTFCEILLGPICVDCPCYL
jgi:hypothetical protein